MKDIFRQIKQFDDTLTFSEGEFFEFVLYPANIVRNDSDKLLEGHSYRIKVRPYMTQVATTGYDFMKRYNNNNPMPVDTMSGKVLKCNRSMVYMQLYDAVTKTQWQGWVVRRAITEYKEIVAGEG